MKSLPVSTNKTIPNIFTKSIQTNSPQDKVGHEVAAPSPSTSHQESLEQKLAMDLIAEAAKKQGIKTKEITSRAIAGAVHNSVLVSAVEPEDADNKFPIEELSVPELQKLMKDGELNSVQLVKSYVHRIKTYDAALSSVVELNPEAEKIARERDRERAEGRIRGPLHGIPVLLKENIATGDEMETTAGSLALMGAKPKEDSFVARALREAGAVILGKTGMGEWGQARSSGVPSGWSARNGQTKNPYDLKRSPMGSSSGSGVAATASFAALALGTDTCGSIVDPASVNGIVGIKPTAGSIDRTGIIPISETLDSVGPMARSVTDATLALAALTGQNFDEALDPNGLKGKRIGVCRSQFGRNPEVDAAMEEAMDQMRQQGATIVEVDLPPSEPLFRATCTVMRSEFKGGLDQYLGGLHSGPKNLDEIIEFNKKSPDEKVDVFGQDGLVEAQSGPNDPEYRSAKSILQRGARGLDQCIEDLSLDAIIAPTTGPAQLIERTDKSAPSVSGTMIAHAAGYPAITVPLGASDELPFGISFFGSSNSEKSLISAAYAYEQVSKKRSAPELQQQS